MRGRLRWARYTSHTATMLRLRRTRSVRHGGVARESRRLPANVRRRGKYAGNDERQCYDGAVYTKRVTRRRCRRANTRARGQNVHSYLLLNRYAVCYHEPALCGHAHEKSDIARCWGDGASRHEAAIRVTMLLGESGETAFTRLLRSHTLAANAEAVIWCDTSHFITLFIDDYWCLILPLMLIFSLLTLCWCWCCWCLIDIIDYFDIIYDFIFTLDITPFLHIISIDIFFYYIIIIDYAEYLIPHYTFSPWYFFHFILFLRHYFLRLIIIFFITSFHFLSSMPLIIFFYFHYFFIFRFSFSSPFHYFIILFRYYTFSLSFLSSFIIISSFISFFIFFHWYYYYFDYYRYHLDITPSFSIIYANSHFAAFDTPFANIRSLIANRHYAFTLPSSIFHYGHQ